MASQRSPRLAKAKEAVAVARVIDAAYQAYRDQRISLPDVSAGVPEAIAAGQVWLTQGEVSGEITGVLMLTVDDGDAHLKNVAVSPSARGQGLGGILIRHAVGLAQARGCRGIGLATHRDLANNIALYQHLGWVETGREGLRVVMYRALDPAP